MPGQRKSLSGARIAQHILQQKRSASNLSGLSPVCRQRAWAFVGLPATSLALAGALFLVVVFWARTSSRDKRGRSLELSSCCRPSHLSCSTFVVCFCATLDSSSLDSAWTFTVTQHGLQAAGEQGREVDADVVFIDLTSRLSSPGRFHLCSRLRRRLQAAGEQGRQVDADVVLIDLTSLLSSGGRFH
ncbi:hypothetical protein AK812_SmicGene48932 [Symbiodinium microadriaticum]|uniref:Uncharacterized protein n=1 Tax=Symbiodinium microadriaticum TaxID=2951 RepID=A0A1Q8ZK55_SYMMI|nr:hypothetical protein AK812_SmicGene48932 [Symbiodinium microadriaticum]